MRPVSYSVHQRKFRKNIAALREMLSRCPDDGFLHLAWSVQKLQTDLEADIRQYINYPPEAKSSAIDGEYAIHQWEIETLLSLLFTTDKYKSRPGDDYFTYHCNQFGTMAKAVNLLRNAEDHESALHLNINNILMEMHRVGHRQFGWQRGFGTGERLFRFAYIYGQGDCASYLETVYNLPVRDFLLVGFLLFAQLRSVPWTKAVAVEKLGCDIPLIEKVLPLFSRSLRDIRLEAQTLIRATERKSSTEIAYIPSILRRFPIITANKSGSYIAPLPELILYRMTNGLYYDICRGPNKLITEANDRFESYVKILIEGFFPKLDAIRSQKYGTKKARHDSPDILLREGQRITVVIECKATKLTYDAQFGENPMEEATNSYGQIIKGITQIWQFFSHVRRGIYKDIPVDDRAHGVLLTMDSWMQASEQLQRDAITRAKELIQRDENIIDEDIRPIAFCSMQDFVDTMFLSNEFQFLGTLMHASTEKYRGWPLPHIRKETFGKGEGRKFPLDLRELLPWWSEILALKG